MKVTKEITLACAHRDDLRDMKIGTLKCRARCIIYHFYYPRKFFTQSFNVFPHGKISVTSILLVNKFKQLSTVGYN